MALRSTQQAGFSAVEVFAAAVIGVILTMVATVGYRIYERQLPVRFVAQRLIHAFNTARAYAIAHNAVFAVQFDPIRRQFWIDQTDAAGQTVVRMVVRPEAIDENVDVAAWQYAQAPPVNGAQAPVRFFPDGSSDDLRITLHLKADRPTDTARTATVRLYGPTGRSKLFEGRVPQR